MSRKTTIKCERCGTEKWQKNWGDDVPRGFGATIAGKAHDLRDICRPCRFELQLRLERIIHEHEANYEQ